MNEIVNNEEVKPVETDAELNNKAATTLISMAKLLNTKGLTVRESKRLAIEINLFTTLITSEIPSDRQRGLKSLIVFLSKANKEGKFSLEESLVLSDAFDRFIPDENVNL